MAENRFLGEYPVIGIRPTIDGRRGALKVRESLEEQTMNMAKAAAELISSKLTIPTIGIGAGAGCDGQILVYQDMLGLFSGFKPKFVKHFAELGEQMKAAFRAYDEEVKAGTYPAEEHTFKMDDDVLQRLY